MSNTLYITCQQAYTEASIAKLLLRPPFIVNNASTEQNEVANKSSISVHFGQRFTLAHYLILVP